MGCGFSKPPEVDTNIEPPSATIDLYYKEVIGNFVAVNSVEDSTFSTKISVKFFFDSVKHEWIQGASEPAHILSIFIGKSGFDVLTKLNEVVGEVEPKPSVISNMIHAKIYPEELPTKPKEVVPPPCLTGAFNKRGHQTKNWKNRFVIVTDGVLKYYESIIAKDEGKEALGSITLNDHEVKSVIIDGKKCLHISSTTASPVKKSMFGSTVVEDKDLHVEMSDDAVQNEWLDGINTHIRYLKELTEFPTIMAKYQAELNDYNERHNITQ
jgi:hypothetical protein